MAKGRFIICVTLEHKMMAKRCESSLLKVFQVQTYTHENFETVVCTAKLQYCLIWTISACSCSLYVVKIEDLNYWQSTFSHFRGDFGNKPCQAFYNYIYKKNANINSLNCIFSWQDAGCIFFLFKQWQMQGVSPRCLNRVDNVPVNKLWQ